VASGDRSRTWFPEMIESLRQRWRSDLGIEEVIVLAHELDRMVQDIRTERDIRPPTYRCPKCGRRVPAGQPRVSVRATILAAGRFGIAADADVRRLERHWKQHRSREQLDPYGRPEVARGTEATAEPHGCTGHASHAGEP
jgi:hypothetical protein